ncbi:phosphonate C-P lyase system protein PhnH [Metabacillus schmidteae]|uniref:phosphonate C-P lyase system protein PhnH n=1 Tax=Metabacillus schmidteae TaxID=2730405 RepID=UPI00158C9F6D|nr:phosphonate C-P lyase system protein PhnH [Metabacillus schmidteae]
MTKVEEKSFDIVHHTQSIYRHVLDSMARPGKVNSLENALVSIEDIPGLSKPLLGLAYTLIDREVNFRVIANQHSSVEKHIVRKTFGVLTHKNSADYLLIEKPLTPVEIMNVIEECKIGTLEDPHASTTILMTVDSISSDEEEGQHLTLKGPGIQTERSIYVRGLSLEWLLYRKKLNREFPLGIDMILVSRDGHVVSFPRTTIIESEGM